MIKVADFGLSESVGAKGYFRQDETPSSVRLPLKWLPPESINDYIFSEKSDVVSSSILLVDTFLREKTIVKSKTMSLSVKLQLSLYNNWVGHLRL